MLPRLRGGARPHSQKVTQLSYPAGPQDPYGQQDPSGQQNPYGQQAPYGQQDPYGQEIAYGQPSGLDAPLRGASIGQAVSRFFQKYATFSGRASRSEFWWWFLVNFLITAALSGINVATAGVATAADPTAGLGPFYWILLVFGLATLIPNLAVGARRLHDTNRSGWWQLIGLVPLIGYIVLVVFWASGPNPAGARYDRNAVAGGAYPTG